MKSIRAKNLAGESMDFYAGIEAACEIINSHSNNGHKLIFIGNGASAAMASHMATDFWKNGRIKSIAFNDPTLLTCLGNDYGYQHVFERPIEMFADKGDVLVAVSSSGKSENILRGVACAREKECRIITMSGFAPDNPLDSMGDINFYAPAKDYGPVEIVHQSICHCLLDTIVEARNGQI